MATELHIWSLHTREFEREKYEELITELLVTMMIKARLYTYEYSPHQKYFLFLLYKQF